MQSLSTENTTYSSLGIVRCAFRIPPVVISQAIERMSVNIHATTGWSDSAVVLCWLSQEPSHWTTFVANKVAEIHHNDRVN